MELRQGDARGVGAVVHAVPDQGACCAQRVDALEMSGVNIRDVDPTDLPFAPQMVVSDVSFISLTYVLPVDPRET